MRIWQTGAGPGSQTGAALGDTRNWRGPGIFLISIHRFSGVSNPVGEGVLVVEAWIPCEDTGRIRIVFNSGRYRYLVIVGGPMQGSGSNPTIHDMGRLGREQARKLGFDTKKLVQISVPAVSSGRTLAGTAVKRWLGSSRISVCCVDVFTVGPHARKSWILSRYAFGDGYGSDHRGISGLLRSEFWLASRRGIWSSFATWPATCTRSSGFYFTGECRKLSQPNRAQDVAGRQVETHRSEAAATFSIPLQLPVTQQPPSMVSVEICLEMNQGLMKDADRSRESPHRKRSHGTRVAAGQPAIDHQKNNPCRSGSLCIRTPACHRASLGR